MIKKNIIALAVVSAITAPVTFAGAPVVYGDFRMSVGQTTVKTDAVSDSTLSAVNNVSRLGVKGSTEKDGITGYYHIQTGANNDGGGAVLSSRFYFAGVKGKFGNVKIGRLSHPYKMAGFAGGFDPFYDSSAGAGNGGSSFGLSNDTNGFLDNSIMYYGKAGPVSYNLGVILDETKEQNAAGRNTDESNGKHGYNAGVKFGFKGGNVGLQYLSREIYSNVSGAPDTSSPNTSLRLHGTFSVASTKITVSYEDIARGKDDTAANTKKLKGSLIYLGAKVPVGSNAVIAQIGSNGGDLTGGREAEGLGYSLGYVLNLTKKTRVTPMYSNVDYKSETMGDRSNISIQLVQSF